MKTTMGTVVGAALVLATAACTAGVGNFPSPIDDKRQPAASGHESAGSSREDPGGSREDPSGATGSGAPSGGTTCFDCNSTYQCSLTASDGTTTRIGLKFTPAAGGCALNAGSSTETTWQCDGSIVKTSDHSTLARWTKTDTGFEFSNNGQTVSCVAVVGDSTGTPSNQ